MALRVSAIAAALLPPKSSGAASISLKACVISPIAATIRGGGARSDCTDSPGAADASMGCAQSPIPSNPPAGILFIEFMESLLVWRKIKTLHHQATHAGGIG